jgi:diguanylate cyclase (GGDEF)-like protein/PAS domain S-box-containing protein
MIELSDGDLRLLLVEDDEDDYLITSDMLAGQGRARFVVEWCPDYDAALQRIREQCHDVYLIDYRLGEHTGLDLVRAGFASGPRAPVLILTGQSDYEIDLEATSLGVTDYLVKQELNAATLERSIRYAVSHYHAMRDLALSEERYALAVRAASDGIWDWDLRSGRIYFSPRWREILGQPEGTEDDDPAAWLDLVHPEDLLRLRAAIAAHLDGRTAHLESEHRIRHEDGTWRWVLSRGLATRNGDGEVTRMAGSMSDITDRLAAVRQLQHDALHDALTGLPNRALLVDRLELAAQRAVRIPTTACAVLFVDIDRFKLVNDSLSHGVGDHLLVALAKRLSAVLRPGDTVARIGGDEFTILLDGIGLDGGEAVAIANRILRSVADPFIIDGHELQVTASIGIALGLPGLTSSELLRNADIAMYDAKRRGRAGCALFDESMHRRVVDRVARETELRQAIEHSLMEVHYQPIVDLATGHLCGLEALARWPSGWSEVTPDEFIPIAEETGVIGALGMHVLRTALADLAGWRADGLADHDLRVSVNLSGRQFEDPRLLDDLRDVIAGSGLPGRALILELTESTLMQEADGVPAIIAELFAMGVAVHLDDFGTGYSSLAALHRFPVDALKIDRSFVAAINASGEAGSDVLVRSTIALAHSLGLHVIAEGIEDHVQLRRLRALGCEYGQGFLFSRPLTAEATRTILVGGSETSPGRRPWLPITCVAWPGAA